MDIKRSACWSHRPVCRVVGFCSPAFLLSRVWSMGAASSWCSSALIKEQYLEEWISWHKRQMVELLLVVTAEFLVVVWWCSSATLTSYVSSSLETVPLWRIVLGPLPFSSMLILRGSHSPACPPIRFPPVKETNLCHQQLHNFTEVLDHHLHNQ